MRAKPTRTDDTGARAARLPIPEIDAPPPPPPPPPLPDLTHERLAWKAGHLVVAGVDEVGRGALAGPVVAAAVVINPRRIPKGVDDSKRLTPKRREELAKRIVATARWWYVARVEAEEIDRINILQASLSAMRIALDALGVDVDHVLVDGNMPIPNWPRSQATVIGGDGRSVSIAAASIIAKVTRDRLMREYDEVWPGYGFGAHVGYGTKAHREAIDRLGPCPLHRRTFRGVDTDDLFSSLDDLDG